MVIITFVSAYPKNQEKNFFKDSKLSGLDITFVSVAVMLVVTSSVDPFVTLSHFLSRSAGMLMKRDPMGKS